MGFSGEFDRIARNEARSAAARNIFNEVEDWRGTRRAVASRRWIWELLQNAKDAAQGNPFSFSLTLKQHALTVQHDAGPFQLRDIVALVEGDSSKQRRAEDTTGKFGKGFLVSHVVSPDVQVRGILADSEKGRFSFAFRLHREGSEGEIKHNIEKCRDALDAVKPYSGDAAVTEFVYQLKGNEDTRSCVDEALRNLKNHAPYLFSFIPELNDITFDLPGRERLVFRTTDRQKVESGRLSTTVKRITVSTPEGERIVLIFSAANVSGAATEVAFEVNSDNRIVTPSVVARVFQNLPLYGTTDFDIPVVVNLSSNCDVDSDRAAPNITKIDTQRAIHNGLAILPALAEWAARQHIHGIHLLAEFGISDEMKREPQSAELWEKSIAETLKALLRCKIVECAAGYIRPDEAAFPSATWVENVPPDKVLLRETQLLLSRRGDSVPVADSVEEWESILTKWETIAGISTHRRLGLNALLTEVQNAESLPGLRRRHVLFTSDDATVAYLCELLHVAANYCDRQKIGAPDGLNKAPVLLNQSGKFREGRSLKLDGGIDAVLKDISGELGSSFRENLVDVRLSSSTAHKLVSQLCGDNVFTVENAVGNLVTRIENRFSAGQPRGVEAQIISKAATKLLVWFAGNPSYAPTDLSSFPLLCADGKLHATNDYHDTFLAPKELMVESDRPWIDLFPDSVRLSDSYLQACNDLQIEYPMLVSFLEERRLGSSALFVTRQISSDAEHFAMMYADKAGTGHKVESLSVTDIVGFTRVLSETASASGSGNPDKAEQVLKFILSYGTVKDTSWKTSVSAPCTRQHGCAGSVVVYPCSWLGRIKHSSWVPSSDGGGHCEPLSLRNVREIWEQLPSEYSDLQETRDFLAQHFGVDRLEMAIRASAGDDTQKRSELRDGLAAVIDTGIDPAELRDIVARHQTASEISTRNGKLGRIVEMLVAEAFRREGFEVKRTGTGSDFRVRLADAKDLEWDKQDVGELTMCATYHGVNVEFLVEVKATQGDVVRMSWRQAETAVQELDRYVLCVVDFTDFPDLFDRVLNEDQPSSELIAPGVGLVPNIGTHLALSVQNLSSAIETEDSGIEVEKAEEIRFRISRQVWLAGTGLEAWAAAVKNQVAKLQAAGT